MMIWERRRYRLMMEWTERRRADQASLWKVKMTLVWGENSYDLGHQNRNVIVIISLPIIKKPARGTVDHIIRVNV